MEKAKHPTSKYKVFCDYYDTKLTAEFHTTDEGETKVKISMGEVDYKETSISLSLYAEDVRILSKVLEQMADATNYRN